jgi:hypothetical protein
MTLQKESPSPSNQEENFKTVGKQSVSYSSLTKIASSGQASWQERQQ